MAKELKMTAPEPTDAGTASSTPAAVSPGGMMNSAPLASAAGGTTVTPPHLPAMRAAGQVRTAATFMRHMTGRTIVVFRPGADAASAAIKSLRNSTGAKLASTADATSGAISAAEIRDAGGVVLQRLNAAVVATSPDRALTAGAASVAGGSIMAIIPVGPLFAIGGWYARQAQGATATPPAGGMDPSASADYLRGFRDGVLSMSGTPPSLSASAAAGPDHWEQSQATWGLQSTRASASVRTGNGVRIAILDTGLDLNHPDFSGRIPPAQQQSFVPSATGVQDGNGHGTHVAGTACGISRPTSLPRYGIASNAQLYIGKILGDDGIGYDDWFTIALDWAMTNGCRVVNMSVARPAAG